MICKCKRCRRRIREVSWVDYYMHWTYWHNWICEDCSEEPFASPDIPSSSVDVESDNVVPMMPGYPPADIPGGPHYGVPNEFNPDDFQTLKEELPAHMHSSSESHFDHKDFSSLNGDWKISYPEPSYDHSSPSSSSSDYSSSSSSDYSSSSSGGCDSGGGSCGGGD